MSEEIDCCEEINVRHAVITEGPVELYDRGLLTGKICRFPTDHIIIDYDKRQSHPVSVMHYWRGSMVLYEYVDMVIVKADKRIQIRPKAEGYVVVMK